MRADAITRTGVIEPFYVRQISPVENARHIIDSFIWSVRQTGFEGMTPWEAQASCDCAKMMVQGETVKVSNGGQTVNVEPGAPPPPGPAGKIVAKAYEILHKMFNPQMAPQMAAKAAAGPAEAGTRAVYIPPPS